MSDIEVVTLEEQPALVIEAKITPDKFGDMLGESYGRIMGHVASKGVEVTGMPFARYHDMSDGTMHLAAGIPIASEVEGDGGDILYQPLPGGQAATAGGQAATALHMGEYHEVGAAWQKLSAWMEENGHGSVFSTLGGWDVYENDPESVSDSSELRTRIYQPSPK